MMGADNYDISALLLLVLSVVVMLVVSGWIASTPSTQQRIEKCVEVTNYTEERCRWEVTR